MHGLCSRPVCSYRRRPQLLVLPQLPHLALPDAPTQATGSPVLVSAVIVISHHAAVMGNFDGKVLIEQGNEDFQEASSKYLWSVKACRSSKVCRDGSTPAGGLKWGIRLSSRTADSRMDTCI